MPRSTYIFRHYTTGEERRVILNDSLLDENVRDAEAHMVLEDQMGENALDEWYLDDVLAGDIDVLRSRCNSSG